MKVFRLLDFSDCRIVFCRTSKIRILKTGASVSSIFNFDQDINDNQPNFYKISVINYVNKFWFPHILLKSYNLKK